MSAENCYSCWTNVISQCRAMVESAGVEVPLPVLTSDMILEICNSSINMLKNQRTVIFLESPIYIVGDLHGSIIDLLRIFTANGLPPNSSYLFLGDYVDRGYFSTEVMTLLFSAMILFPKKIFLIRGNHEFADINKSYGFYDELVKVYPTKGEELFSKFNEAFSYLPLAAVVNDDMFCVHGGISPGLASVGQIIQLQRPITSCKNNLIRNLLWADPNSRFNVFAESKRGEYVEYGPQAVQYFYESSKMKYLIRAHQCVQHGIKIAFNNVITVFSSSAYTDTDNNESGVLYVKQPNDLHPLMYPPIYKTLNRDNCLFYSLSTPKFIKPNLGIPTTISPTPKQLIPASMSMKAGIRQTPSLKALSFSRKGSLGFVRNDAILNFPHHADSAGFIPNHKSNMQLPNFDSIMNINLK